MTTIAYLANEFPSPVEPYVMEEIAELERKGIEIVTGSVRRSRSVGCIKNTPHPQIVLQSLSLPVLGQAVFLCVFKRMQIGPLILRILIHGREGPLQRIKAVAHTLLGACYAVRLQGRGVEHIHVHHGYFGSWVAMTAARLLGISFSMTLHGSDLLLHAAYLDVKLDACKFCLTISDYNRDYILAQYPNISSEKIVVSRMGTDVPTIFMANVRARGNGSKLKLLAVGRLHPVKDHAFLIRACAQLAAMGVEFACSIAGEGSERSSLENLIMECGLGQFVTLLGHIDSAQLGPMYDSADVVTLTSRSEGIPIVLMEAMARSKIVLAPAITGVPELVIPGKTGFLYRPGSISDFLGQLLFIRSMILATEPARSRSSDSANATLDWIRHAARVQVLHNFNRTKNLRYFSNLFLKRISSHREQTHDENFVLQQI
ncbi:MAG: glycosyltransferase family 4 protein [Candidatus Sulfotelmatobacter sp.]